MYIYIDIVIILINNNYSKKIKKSTYSNNTWRSKYGKVRSVLMECEGCKIMNKDDKETKASSNKISSKHHKSVFQQNNTSNTLNDIHNQS